MRNIYGRSSYEWNLKTIALAIAIIIILVTNIYLYIQGNMLKGEMDKVSKQMDQLQQDMKNQLSEGLSEFQAELTKQSSVISEVRYSLGALDSTTDTITVIITVVPKEYVRGTAVTLNYIVDKGLEQTVDAVEGTGMTYVATLNIPLCDTIDYNIVVSSAGKSIIEKGKTINNIKEKYGFSIDKAVTSGTYSYDGKAAVFDSDIYLYLSNKDENTTIKEATFKIFNNGEAIASHAMTVTKAGTGLNLPSFSSDDTEKNYIEQTYKYSMKAEAINVKAKDRLTFMVLVEDSNGLIYQETVADWLIEWNKKMTVQYISGDLKAVEANK